MRCHKRMEYSFSKNDRNYRLLFAHCISGYLNLCSARQKMLRLVVCRHMKYLRIYSATENGIAVKCRMWEKSGDSRWMFTYLHLQLFLLYWMLPSLRVNILMLISTTRLTIFFSFSYRPKLWNLNASHGQPWGFIGRHLGWTPIAFGAGANSLLFHVQKPICSNDSLIIKGL